MILDRKPHTVGDRRQYIVDYSEWLSIGVTVTNGTASTTSTTTSVDTVTHTTSMIKFFLNAGLLNEVCVVSLQMTDSNGEVKNDTIEFFVRAP